MNSLFITYEQLVSRAATVTQGALRLDLSAFLYQSVVMVEMLLERVRRIREAGSSSPGATPGLRRAFQ